MKKLFLIPLMLLLVGALVFVGCGGEPVASGPSAIKIGHIAALTGKYAGFGTGGAFGVEACVDDINADGGLYMKDYGRKIPVELVLVNSESDPNKAASLAEDLITRDKVAALVSGHTPPPMMAGVAAVAQRYKTPYLHSGSPLEPTLGLRNDAAEPWDYIWHGGFSIATPAPAGSFYDKPGYTILDVAMSLMGEFGPQSNKVVGIYASDDSDGIAWYGIFGGAIEDSGYNVVGNEKKLGLAPGDTTDFSSIVNEWIDNDVEIIWGNAPAPFTGTLLRQAQSLGFTPKMWYAARGGLFYSDVSSWGGDIPWGIGCEGWWDSSYQGVKGIGSTTPQSLAARWCAETGLPLNPNIGSGYASVQIVTDVIGRAGSIDAAAINAAFPATNMTSMIGHNEFDENHYSLEALYFFQWQKTDTPEVWAPFTVVSAHDWIPKTGTTIWPKPW